ncbi:HAMP domain-containing protein [Nocardioides sp.]|uniref:HAMP domain-containing protein n=1 Tax=Nocardioides sp. TaxID=35761 RepID=UPI002D802C61|nr:HAMP domain-containing protein [Nocardioides sp.]HET8959215.1 HAMP domain-containing protein [Nocardioides sp.]
MPSSKTGGKRTSGPVRRASAPTNGSGPDGADATELKRLLASMKSMRDGNFRRRMPVTGDGTMAELYEVYNEIAERQQHLASELNRVRRVAGREGRYTERLEHGLGEGGWAKSIDAANGLVSDLVRPTSELARVIAGVSEGDLTQRMNIRMDDQPMRGEPLRLARSVNRVVDQLSSIADEITRVTREVGTEGKLGGQAKVSSADGSWRDLIDAVNTMSSRLTDQVRDIATVTTAVANGDLSRTVTVEVAGEMAQLKDTVDRMVDQLSSFASEVTRVAREVGTEGRLGGQAHVRGVAGTWKDLTDSVNTMASNLTGQVRGISSVAQAVAQGDLSRQITVTARGEIAELAETLNSMTGTLQTFAGEVTRVAREVGTEGILGGQADVPGVSGTWKDLTDSVNFMASNLTNQVRNIAEVTTAVARGDLSQKITVDVRGELSELKTTVNVMVDQLSSFADEVTRVAREVGGEGRLGGQAAVPGVSGTWRDLTDSVNFMAGTLTSQVRNIAEVTTAVAGGDLTRKITVEARGEILELKSTINTMVDQLSAFADEVTRVAREVGTEGRLGGQAAVPGVAGTWRDLTDSVNSMANNLTDQVRSIALVSTAVARGDLSQKISIEARGEVAALAGTINAMVDTLRAFADEVTRVAREVGTEGILGGQAHVRGVAGTWKDLTESVNSMAGNLTSQVRSIALVTTAVANGDLTQKTYVDARGEILELKTTVNRMVDQLSSFADEVTRVAREVGTEGKLGGQAQVADVSGTWRKLTENVNQLAGTLTTQLRAIAEVSTAVTQGDLSQQISVQAQGEVAELKDNLNQMIDNLRETTRANQDQDWLKTNLAQFTGHMQGGRDLLDLSRLIVSELTPLVGASQGSFFLSDEDAQGEVSLRRMASYGYRPRKGVPSVFALGEGLVGQVALERSPIMLKDVPGDYIRISSGLGEAPPLNIVILPAVFEEQVLGVVELASFNPFSPVQMQFLEQLMESIGVSLNAIIASSRTQELLVESQRLASELQEKSGELEAQQKELQQTNAELEDKASLLAAQNRAIEIKNLEIEDARRGLEDRAEQLALSSKYKSEFLANMSHELRTPLNSLLILAKLLAENAEGNLNSRQVEFSRTIHTAGTDLLQLINDILDLSKVEAGKMDVHFADVALSGIVEYVDATFRPLTAEKDLRFSVSMSDDVDRILYSDQHRLQQVLRNLLSNAVKFTSSGEVKMVIQRATDHQHFVSESLTNADQVIAFSVSDTGIGIPAEQLKVIFEAFQQADGTISRKFGGTGLGLSISRAIAELIGGEIHAESVPGQGSTFTLYVPRHASSEASPLRLSAPTSEVVEGEVSTGDAPADEVDRSGRVLLVALSDDDLREKAVAIAQASGARVVASSKPETILISARQHRPDGILVGLDMRIDSGESLLQSLKHNHELRHIPTVGVLTPGAVESAHEARLSGALDVVEEPASSEQIEVALQDLSAYLDRRTRSLLVVTSNVVDETSAVVALFGAVTDVVLRVKTSVNEAIAALENGQYDCVVVDLKLSGGTGFDVIKRMRARKALREIPVVVSTGDTPSKRDLTRLGQYAQRSVVAYPSSIEQLIDQIALFLHRSDVELPAPEATSGEQLHQDDEVFVGKRILIVDDDVRNVFALTSALEPHNLDVVYAGSGEEGIQMLQQDQEIDLVLMDVMMPGMDGYTAMREIRKVPAFRSLPVIALTAKAMPGDRENSLSAGASDYVTKPVDIDRLLNLLRLWLS